MAKIVGIKLCDAYRAQYGCNYISAMPTNVYGPHDNYDLKNSHVLPALLRKFHEAKHASVPEIEVWGTGTPRREFLHVDDLADACHWLLGNHNEPGLVNLGTGTDLSICELAELVQRTVGYEGSIRFKPNCPDGTPRKLMDVSKLVGFDWTARIGLGRGVRQVYEGAFGVA